MHSQLFWRTWWGGDVTVANGGGNKWQIDDIKWVWNRVFSSEIRVVERESSGCYGNIVFEVNHKLLKLGLNDLKNWLFYKQILYSSISRYCKWCTRSISVPLQPTICAYSLQTHQLPWVRLYQTIEPSIIRSSTTKSIKQWILLSCHHLVPLCLDFSSLRFLMASFKLLHRLFSMCRVLSLLLCFPLSLPSFVPGCLSMCCLFCSLCFSYTEPSWSPWMTDIQELQYTLWKFKN